MQAALQADAALPEVLSYPDESASALIPGNPRARGHTALRSARRRWHRRTRLVVYVSVFEVLRVRPGTFVGADARTAHAARQFAHLLEADGVARATARIDVELYGGLACAGRDERIGRRDHRGACGRSRRTDATQSRCNRAPAAVKTGGTLALNGRQPVAFDADRDIAYRVDRSIEGASNAIAFRRARRTRRRDRRARLLLDRRRRNRRSRTGAPRSRTRAFPTRSCPRPRCATPAKSSARSSLRSASPTKPSFAARRRQGHAAARTAK